jgi:hypothetical protein
MFAWSSQQQYLQHFRQPQQQLQQQQQQQPLESEQQQPSLQGANALQEPQQQQQQQQQQQADGLPWPAMLRTGAVVLALQGPVEMELLIAQVCFLEGGSLLVGQLRCVQVYALYSPLSLTLRESALHSWHFTDDA